MGRLGWVLVAGLALAGAVSASNTACSGQSLGTLQSAADNGNTPANGCGTVDLAFNGFVVGNSGVVSGQTLDGPSAANIDIGASSDSYTLSSDGWTTGTKSQDSETLGSEIAFSVTLSPGDTAGGLTAPSITGFNGKGDVIFTETFCLGATSAAGCNAADQGSVAIDLGSSTVLSATCGSISAGFGCVANNLAGAVSFNGVNNVFVQDIVNITHPATDGRAYTSSITDVNAGFDLSGPWVTAEPSTLAMLGSALVGIGLIRRRNWRRL